MHKHVLEGCTPIPISNYLKSLGLLRILSEQTEFKITAYWENEKFVLETDVESDEIIKFLLKKYVPTPILIPWSYNKYQKTIKMLEPIINDKRFAIYQKIIDEIKTVLDEFENIRIKKESDKKSKTEDIIKDQKDLFLKLCRNMLSDEIIRWLDAVFVLTENKTNYAPILVSGGNDGNFDMAENFVKKLIMLLGTDEKENVKSENWLKNTLFGGSCALDVGSVIGHNPDGDGKTTPNAGMGFTGKSLSNPWDYVLMMEGTLLFAGNMARRQSANTGKAVFPFSTSISSIGYATASDQEEDKGEIWLPIWKTAATYVEINHIFKEGRVQLGRKQAETGTEFARAAISLGTERGIDEFKRYCVMKRKGDAHLYIYAGKINVADDSKVYLLDELDDWYKKISKESKKKESSDSLKRLVRNHDVAILNYCKYRNESHMLEILISVGRIQRHVSNYFKKLKPLSKLSPGWLEKCYDGSAEFRLAASLASIQSERGVGGIRENLENIKQENGTWVNNKDFISFVWNENNDLVGNMENILKRRTVDGKIASLNQIPIKGWIFAEINDIVEFLNGNLDTKKIGNLILPLSMMDLSSNPWRTTEYKDPFKIPIPEAYAIIKLIYPSNQEEKIPYDATVLNLLGTKRIKDAYARASYILHAHRLSPKTYSKDKGVNRNIIISNILEKYLMASILFPISKNDRESMLKLVTVQNKSMKDEAINI